MPDDPKISVIIPVFNAEKYLRECLDSVVNQTLRDIEIICVDDGSTDDSLEVIEEYAREDRRIIIVNQKNAGAGAARNAGIMRACGEYLHFLDADDYLVLNAYETLFNRAEEHKLDVLVAKVYGIDAKTLEMVHNPWYTLSALSPRDFDRVVDFYQMPKKFVRLLVAPWNRIYRRSFIVEHNLLFNHLTCVNDRSFYVSVIVNARSVMFIDYFMLYYRTNVPTSLVNLRARHFDCHFQSYEIISKLCSRLPSDLRFVVLESELTDMFGWYAKFQKQHILDHEIYEQTKQFVTTIDMSVFRGRLYQCRWYGYYSELAGIRSHRLYTRIRGLFYRALLGQ